jgi:hypothetical protein
MKNVVDVNTIIEKIKYSIETKTPFSAIRFNDGEAIMLGYPDFIDENTIRSVWKGHFGTNEFTEEKINKLKQILVDSCHNADIIGIPTPQNRHKGHYALVEDELIPKYDLLKNADPAYASFHRNIQEGVNQYEEILSRVNKLYCVTGRDVKSTIERAFGVECEVIQITPQIAFAKESHNNHPEIYDDIVKEISEKSEGNLWFIGAGFYAKGYCKTIKENGGIAVDIGSMFDAWMGIASRGFINKNYKI